MNGDDSRMIQLRKAFSFSLEAGTRLTPAAISMHHFDGDLSRKAFLNSQERPSRAASS